MYNQVVKNGNPEIDFWGYVPPSMFDATKHVADNFERNLLRTSGTSKIEELRSILRTYHKQLGIYSPKVEENLALLDNGSVLTGQQPVVFGGPGFIGNKIACTISLAELLRKSDVNLAPIFFIGDYDGLQKELARQYYPNPISHNAFILDSDGHLPEESTIASHAAELPPVEWLDNSLDKFEENLRGFKKSVKGVSKKLFDERWSHIRTIIKTAFTTSSTLSEWAVSIWGYITNIIEDYGIIYLPTSHPAIRKLVADQYFRFIENSTEYTTVFQEAMDRIRTMGYEPTLPHRHDDYAPFTIECEEDNSRITTSIQVRDDRRYAEGECPACKKFVSYTVNSVKDLQKIAVHIGPRVDTSQAVFQDLMNIRIRVSGPGEIAYYAQAAPAIKAIGFEMPIFVKYKRAFYNSNWIENLGKQLEQRKQGTLHQSKLFDLLRARVNSLKEDDKQGLITAEFEMEEFIRGEFNNLINGKDSKDALKYLGWQFGRFTPEKFGQEVSWVWFDMAMQTGVSDYIGSYKRMYTKYSVPGTYYYVNTMI